MALTWPITKALRMIKTGETCCRFDAARIAIDKSRDLQTGFAVITPALWSAHGDAIMDALKVSHKRECLSFYRSR